MESTVFVSGTAIGSRTDGDPVRFGMSGSYSVGASVGERVAGLAEGEGLTQCAQNAHIFDSVVPVTI